MRTASVRSSVLTTILLFLAVWPASLHAAAGTYTVTNTNDSGPGSLRQAILDNNNAGGEGTINFAIGTGPQTIRPVTMLPLQEKAFIDGRTQPGFDGAPIIEIDGSLTAGMTSGIGGFAGTVHSLVINNFPNRGVEARFTTVMNCYIGTDITGTLARGNDTGIDGHGWFEGNLISGNSSRGVFAWGSSTIVRNRIGTDATGNAVLGGVGMSILVSSTTLIEDNVIGGSTHAAIFARTANNLSILNNFIGISRSGVPLPNFWGVVLDESDSTSISGNQFLNNEVGVVVTEKSLRTSILDNRFENNGLGIDLSNTLSPNGPTPNDDGDADLGGNNLTNFPVITRATSINGTTTIEGTLHGANNRNYTVQLYVSPSCSSSGHGEGSGVLDSFSVITNAGVATFVRTLSQHVTSGQVITATATSTLEGTSEFSLCREVEGAGTFSFQPIDASVTELAGSGLVTVQRTGGAAGAATVQFASTDGTAHAGTDYVALSGTLTFADGETSKTIPVEVMNDGIHEGPQAFMITLSNASGAAIGSPSTLLVKIQDAQQPPELTIQSPSLPEGNSGNTSFPFIFTLSKTSEGKVAVNYKTTGVSAQEGSDFVDVSTSLTFAPDELQKTVFVTVLGDTELEQDETFVINWFFENTNGTSDPAVIKNDDRAPGDDAVSVSPGVLQIPVGDSRAVTIQIGTPFASDLVFPIVSSHPDDIGVAPSSVLLPAGVGNATFDVSALGVGRSGFVTVTFPEVIGGGSRQVQVSTYAKAELTFSPGTLEFFRGQTTTVHATLVPANTEPVTIQLSRSNDIVEIPSDFVIAPGGQGSFAVHAVEQGSFVLNATLPEINGSATYLLRGHVASATKPVILSLSPADGSAAGGTEVEVRGLLLRGNCTVLFGDVEATSFSFFNAERFIVTTPPHSAGLVDVTLRCGSDSQVLPNAFLYRNAAANLSAVTPSTGSVSGGTFVRITGDNFLPECWPVFGGVKSPEAYVHDDHTMTAVAPSHAAGVVDVSLLCTGNQAVLAGGFTYAAGSDPAAQIASIEPLFGGPGEIVTIRGTHLRLDDTITFGGSPATILDSTPEAHVVVVPDVPVGQVSVAIEGAGVTASTSGPMFMVGEAAPPSVTHVAEELAVAGAEVELEGRLLRAPYTFAFGGKRAQIVTMSPSQAVVRLPQDLAPGTYPTAVLNGNGQVASIGAPVTVTAEGLLVYGLDRRCGTTAGGIDVIIKGKGFASGATVMFGSIPATAVALIDAMTIQARVPPNAAGPATIAVINPDHSSATRTNAFHYSSPFDPTPNCTDGRGRAVRH